jgi:HD-like signal output (HDOD) protein
MLDVKIRNKLESLTELPTIPYVIADVLQALDNNDIRAANLASLIERDQTLTARVLRVANSPFYGFVRRISTIELAIVLLGFNTIKEIVVSLILKKFISRSKRSNFDTKAFWEYSVFCGAASRVLARKLGYRLVGEAFVAGLMHDIGILIMSEYFTKEFRQMRAYQEHFRTYMIEAERQTFHCTHSDIGAWFAERWYLPKQLCEAILYHHHNYSEMREQKLLEENEKKETQDKQTISQREQKFKKENENDQLLISIVAMSEWFAMECGFKKWSYDKRHAPLFLANVILEELSEHDILTKESAIEVLKVEIIDEYEKAQALTELTSEAYY